MARILVTGGAGFIGSHVTQALLDAGHDVSVVDVFHPAAHRAAPMRATLAGAPLTVADVRERPAMDEAAAGVDVVVHQAAMVGMGVNLDDLPEYVGCNDLGTAVLLAAMGRAGVSRLVLASSMVVYGEGKYTCAAHGKVDPAARATAALTGGGFEPTCPHCQQPLAWQLVDEDDPIRPRSGYAATKAAQEHLASAWARQTGSVAVGLRYHNVYGPGMPRDTPYSGVAAIFRSSLESGRAPQVFEDGGQRRDFVHVRDVARANVAAVDALLAGSVAEGLSCFNVASGRPATILEMATALAAAVDGPTPQVTGQFRAGDVRHIVASAAKAEAQLGFKAAISLTEGMPEFAKAPLRD